MEETSLQKLLREKKGKTTYKKGEAFLLQVFWECPNEQVAQKLLSALEKCARATHRDTPCVPTYFFRMSKNDVDLYGEAPTLVKDHLQLSCAIKKLRVGIPRGAIIADLQKRGIDPSFLDLDFHQELPESLKGQKPVAIEFTEVYLDERAFFEHAGSQDYLDGYAGVMSPGTSNKPPATIRLGSPTKNLIDTILDPILKESVVELDAHSTVWNPSKWSDSHLLLSLDFDKKKFKSLHVSYCVWSINFDHPFREDTVRWMLLLPSEPTKDFWASLIDLSPIRGEVYVADKYRQQIKNIIESAGLSVIHINEYPFSGYILHEKVGELSVME